MPTDELRITEKGLKKLLRKSIPRRATDLNMIPARLLQKCSDEHTKILAIIFNKSLEEGTAPSDWKQANVTAIFQKGQCYDPANHRRLLDLSVL